MLHCSTIILYAVPKLFVMLEHIVSHVSPNRSENIYVFTLGNYSNSNEHKKTYLLFIYSLPLQYNNEFKLIWKVE